MWKARRSSVTSAGYLLVLGGILAIAVGVAAVVLGGAPGRGTLAAGPGPSEQDKAMAGPEPVGALAAVHRETGAGPLTGEAAGAGGLTQEPAAAADPGAAGSNAELANGSEVADEAECDTNVMSTPPADDLAALESARVEVEAALSGEPEGERPDLLARFGRSSAAAGRFEVSAAAYAMFLQEFGSGHPYSGRIAVKLVESLAPLDLDSVEVEHRPSGPVYRPAWRMQHTPDERLVRQAVSACDLAAELAPEPAGVGWALGRIGWIHRALGDWEASTAAWDRCAAEAPGTPAAAEALWRAAENLRWTGRPAAGAERLRQLIAGWPDSPEVRTAKDRLDMLEAEARRGSDWLADPVASLEAEIRERRASRPAHEVYGRVMPWLQRRDARPAAIAVARWACTQMDWPADARQACRADLIDALLTERADEADRLEAVDCYAEMMELASGEREVLALGIREARLLGELGHFERGDEVLDSLAVRLGDGPTWRPRVLGEKIRQRLERGDRAGAWAVFETLSSDYPDHDLIETFAPVFSSPDKEASR